MTQRIKILIADDHPMVVDGLVDYFKDRADMEVVATTNSVSQVQQLISRHLPDILLMDYHFSHETLTGLDMCRQLTAQKVSVKMIIISSFSDIALVKEFMTAGASGYLLKTATRVEFIEAVQNVFAGGEWFGKDVRELLIHEKLQNSGKPAIKFTRVEKEILKLIIEGASTQEIAKKTFREKSTVDSHRKSILYKLQAMAGDEENTSKNIMYYVSKLDLGKNIDRL